MEDRHKAVVEIELLPFAGGQGRVMGGECKRSTSLDLFRILGRMVRKVSLKERTSELSH